MSNLEHAIVLAAEAHKGQVDKGGNPYILHPLRVMLACDTEAERIAAMLHDTVEDTYITFADIRRVFGDEIMLAVQALTRSEGESYRDFIDRCALNPIAKKVKLADLRDNMDVTRLGRELTGRDAERLTKYQNAERRLTP